MKIGGHHEMPARVWVAVEDDKAVLPPIDDQRFLIIGSCCGIAEDAAPSGPILLHVRGAPWRPQVIHSRERAGVLSLRLEAVRLAVVSGRLCPIWVRDVDLRTAPIHEIS